MAQASVDFAMDWTTWYVRKRFSDVSQLTTDNLQKSIDHYLVLDTRRKDEYDVSHLPNAQRLHFRSPDSEIGHFLDNLTQEQQSGQVVCYCSVGWRSSHLARRLQAEIKARGLSLRVHNLEGSIFKWANEGRPLVDGEGHQTQSAHPFNTVFGWLLDRDKRHWPNPSDSSAEQ